MFFELALCTGVNGLGLGISAVAPVRLRVAVEPDPYCVKVLSARYPNVPIWDRVETFNGVAWRGKINLITSGFPCQPIAAPGKRLGTKDPRWIWESIGETIRDVRPEWVFLENVPRIISCGLISVVLGTLAKLGYDARWGVFSCGSLGASHRRERWFCLAKSNSREQGPGLEWEERISCRPMSEVAHSKQQQQQQLRFESGWSSREDGSGETFAEYPGKGVEHSNRFSEGYLRSGGPTEQPTPGNAGCPVANSQSGRRTPSRGCPEVPQPVAGDFQLAHTHGQGPQEGTPGKRSQQALVGEHPHLWAPGPNADWSEIPARLHPSQWSVRRLAHGFPRGVEQPVYSHQLRALGNSASPVAAAHAWIRLGGPTWMNF